MKMLSHNQMWSLVLGLLVLRASLGLSINLHYCKGHIASIGFISTPSSCDTQKGQHTCSYEKSTEANDCCHNETLHFDSLDGDFLATWTSQSITEQWQYILPPAMMIAHHSDLISPIKDELHLYKPPLPPLKYYILFDSYLL